MYLHKRDQDLYDTEDVKCVRVRLTVRGSDRLYPIYIPYSRIESTKFASGDLCVNVEVSIDNKTPDNNKE